MRTNLPFPHNQHVSKHKLTLIEEAAVQTIHNVANNRIVHSTQLCNVHKLHSVTSHSKQITASFPLGHCTTSGRVLGCHVRVLFRRVARTAVGARLTARGAGRPRGGDGGGACVRNPLPTCSSSIPFLQDGLAFKKRPSTHRYRRGRRFAVTLFICTAANNKHANNTSSARLLLLFLLYVRVKWRVKFGCLFSSFRYACSACFLFAA